MSPIAKISRVPGSFTRLLCCLALATTASAKCMSRPTAPTVVPSSSKVDDAGFELVGDHEPVQRPPRRTGDSPYQPTRSRRKRRTSNTWPMGNCPPAP